MSGLLKWIWMHPVPAAEIGFFIVLAILCSIAMFQSRELSLWPPRIGGRPIRLNKGNDTGSKEISVIDAIKIRKSVRSYKARPVEKEKASIIMEAARLAPSASNRQEWRFVIVDDKETVKRIANVSCISTFIKHPPCIIAACADTDFHVMRCRQQSYPIDVAIALDHISLAAVQLGLGTCWIGIFDEEKVKEIIQAPEKIRVVALMVLGYPKDNTAVEKKRLPIDKIMKYNQW